MLCHTADPIEASQSPQVLENPSRPYRKRKREHEAGRSSPQGRDWPPSKRTRISPSSCTAEEKLHPEAASDTSESRSDPLQPWIQNGRWPKEYFEQESQVREDFKRGKSPEVLEQRDWLQEHCLKELFRPMHGFYYLPHLFARERSSSSLRRKNSESSFQTPSDQLPRKVQSAQCRTIEYEIGLENKVGSGGLRFDQQSLYFSSCLCCLKSHLLSLLETEDWGDNWHAVHHPLGKAICMV